MPFSLYIQLRYQCVAMSFRNKVDIAGREGDGDVHRYMSELRISE